MSEMPIAPVAKSQPKAAPQSNDEVLEVYDTYHNCDEIKSFKVIENEITRCEGLVSQLKGFNDELVEALEDRIDTLKFAKESIEGDIKNEFLSPQGYMK